MNIFEFVKSKVSILDVVSEYVTLKPAGRYWKGPSPFKHERTPSFTVSPHKDIYYCFSSGQGGDVISFIAGVEHCTQLEAAHYLIDRYKLQVPETIEWKKISSQEMGKRESYEKTCTFFAHWCMGQLKQSVPAQAYLNKRSLTPAIIQHFMIGYCPAGAAALHDLVTQAHKQSILLQDFLDAHILIQGKQGLYSPYEDRIMFPIHNHVGSCCGFGGRVFKEQDDRAKYYNSQEHTHFAKSTILFGLHTAKKSIQQGGTAFLVEGYLDCITMVQYGYTNSLATLGTACTIDHLKQIARHSKKLYVVYDGDEAGQKAIIRLAQLCWQVNLELFIVGLPATEDPASFLTKGNSLEPLIAAAENIFLFSIKKLGNQFFSKSLQEKLGHINQLCEVIAQLSDTLQKDILLNSMATTFDIPFDTLKNHLRQSQARLTKMVQRPLQSEVAEQTEQEIENMADFQDIPPLEKKLFSAILHNETGITAQELQFFIEHVSLPLATMLTRYYASGAQDKPDFDAFFNSLSKQEQNFVSNGIIEHGSVSAQHFEQLMHEFHKKQWKTVVQELKQKITQHTDGSPEGTESLNKLLAEFNELKKKRERGYYE